MSRGPETSFLGGSSYGHITHGNLAHIDVGKLAALSEYRARSSSLAVHPNFLNGWGYPPIYVPQVRTHWFPPHLVRMVPQNHAPEYTIQEFDYFVVIDFEATCDKLKNPHPQEIIEFPSVLVNGRTGQIEDSFRTYVRPTHHQQLTDFCKHLTGIQQSQVDQGVLLSDALLLHDKWLEEKGVKHKKFAVVTWSSCDCRVILESECRFKKLKKPPYFNRWINLKIPFAKAFDGARGKLKDAVELAGLTWEGRAHSGLDDAKNTANLLIDLMSRGVKLSITNTIKWEESADYPTVTQQQIPTRRPTYVATGYRWKNPPYITVVPKRASPTNEPCVYCYCGAASVKKEFKKSENEKDGFFFGCGKCNAYGPCCNFFKWVPASETVKAR
ncbi:hypothetical protein RND81_12G175900 [Saponaria officinalis]